MAHRWENNLIQADVTPEPLWLNRRQGYWGCAMRWGIRLNC